MGGFLRAAPQNDRLVKGKNSSYGARPTHSKENNQARCSKTNAHTQALAGISRLSGFQCVLLKIFRPVGQKFGSDPLLANASLSTTARLVLPNKTF